jgi:hypothetical protein
MQGKRNFNHVVRDNAKDLGTQIDQDLLEIRSQLNDPLLEEHLRDVQRSYYKVVDYLNMKLKQTIN